MITDRLENIKTIYNSNKRKQKQIYKDVKVAQDSIIKRKKFILYLNLRDTIYDSLWFKKYVQTTLVKKGEKEKGENILYKVLHALKIVYTGLNSFSFLFESSEKLKSSLEIRSRRLGSNFISIPVYILGTRRIKVTLLKFRKAFVERKEFQVYIKIIKEIFSILRIPKESYLCQLDIKLWEVMYQNRAYLHYRWY